MLTVAFLDFNQAKSSYVLADDINQQYVKSNSLRNQYILYYNQYVLEQIDTQETEKEDLLQLAISQIVGEEDQQLLQQIFQYNKKIKNIFGRVIKNHEFMIISNVDQRPVYVELEKRLISQLLLKTSDIGQVLQSLLNNANLHIQENYEKLVIVTILFTVLLATTIIVVMTKLGRMISRKLVYLHEGARIVAGGDLNHRIHGGGGDEFAELAQSINSVTTNLQSFTRKLELEILARKKTEADLIEAKVIAEKANSAKSEFLSAMSHELRTPLTSSLGSLGLLSALNSDDFLEKGPDLVEMALRNNRALLRLVNELLDYEKVLSGTLIIETSKQDICALTLNSIKDLQGYAETQSVRFVLKENPDPLFAEVHEHRVEQILNNVLSNAAKFSDRGSEVNISITRQNSHVVVSIEDSGAGIPNAFKDKIFEKFTQVDASNTRQHRGTGLGLAISKALAEGMGGSIRLETEFKVGSTFFISLPASE